MISRVGLPTIAGRRVAARASTTVALVVMLAGCGSTLRDDDLPAGTDVAAFGTAAGTAGVCAPTVLETLSGVVRRVYHEGVQSERTAAARALIANSAPLREAVETDDPAAARAAARSLLATGHMSNLRVMRGERTLVQIGGAALSPLHGTLTGADGEPIATYTASVWADTSFAVEADGIAEGDVALRAGRTSVDGHDVGGSLKLGAVRLADAGTLTRDHVVYQYTSFPAESYPAGDLRVYLFRSVPSTAVLCGHTGQDTVVNTLERVANLVYDDEVGPITLPQIRRVQHNRPLLEAVARHEAEATRLAIDSLLNHHIVRLRVSDSRGQLLADVGGPFVLAPVRAPLMLGGRRIGSFVMSIQDDEGYLRLARRLAGLDVLMYVKEAHPQPHPQLVKDSLGPEPGTVPAAGSYTYKGQGFRVFTIHAEAFPSGPLMIRVLVPIPYPTSSSLAAELARAAAVRAGAAQASASQGPGARAGGSGAAGVSLTQGSATRAWLQAPP